MARRVLGTLRADPRDRCGDWEKPPIHRRTHQAELIRTGRALVPEEGIEPSATPLSRGYSTTELFRQTQRASDAQWIPPLTPQFIEYACYFQLAPRVGFEPTTTRLTVERSTTELPGNAGADDLAIRRLLARLALLRLSRGIFSGWSGRWDSNPRHRAWKARALPLSYVRNPSRDATTGDLERAKGFEPSTPTLARSCSTPELRPPEVACGCVIARMTYDVKEPVSEMADRPETAARTSRRA